MIKKRADKLLVEKGYINSRERAKKTILDGTVYIGGKKISKPSQMVLESSYIDVRSNPLAYVSRAGMKLQKALEYFKIELEGLTCLDIGSSTGGFTQCMLESDSKLVYSLDVGKDQLVEKLKDDPRVVVMEGTNIREVSKKNFSQDIDFITIDVSFISLNIVLPIANEILRKDGSLVALIKPQFEVGKDNIGKKGIVKDKKLHFKVLKTILELSIDLGLEVIDLTYSPIKGSRGNIEFLIYLRKNNEKKAIPDDYLYKVIEEANKL